MRKSKSKGGPVVIQRTSEKEYQEALDTALKDNDFQHCQTVIKNAFVEDVKVQMPSNKIAAMIETEINRCVDNKNFDRIMRILEWKRTYIKDSFTPKIKIRDESGNFVIQIDLLKSLMQMEGIEVYPMKSLLQMCAISQLVECREIYEMMSIGNQMRFLVKLIAVESSSSQFILELLGKMKKKYRTYFFFYASSKENTSHEVFEKMMDSDIIDINGILHQSYLGLSTDDYRINTTNCPFCETEDTRECEKKLYTNKSNVILPEIDCGDQTPYFLSEFILFEASERLAHRESYGKLLSNPKLDVNFVAFGKCSFLEDLIEFRDHVLIEILLARSDINVSLRRNTCLKLAYILGDVRTIKLIENHPNFISEARLLEVLGEESDSESESESE